MYEIYDTVTADTLELGDQILLDDAATSELVYVTITSIDDSEDNLLLTGDDENDIEYKFINVAPDTRIDLWMLAD